MVVPIDRRHSWDCANEFARGVTVRLAKEAPEQIAAKMGPKNRVGKIFVDYLRNQRGASTVAAFSARARPGLPVSVPIARDELDQISGADQWTILNLFKRLEHQKHDPWADYATTRQTLSAQLMKDLAARQ